MNKPTAYPWRVILDDTGSQYTGWPSIVAPEDVDTAIVHRAGFKQEHWGDLSQQECVANAHLMAAAPELRDTAIELFQLLNRFDVEIPPGLLVKYNVAIAKSMGREFKLEDLDEEPADTAQPNPAYLRCLSPSAELAVIVGRKPLPRTEVTKKVWDYIKRNGLQDVNNRRMINADTALKAVFAGKKSVSMFEMTKLISDHLKV